MKGVSPSTDTLQRNREGAPGEPTFASPAQKTESTRTLPPRSALGHRGSTPPSRLARAHGEHPRGRPPRPARVGHAALPHGRDPVRPGRPARRHPPGCGRAAALPRACVHRQLSGEARLRPARRLPGLPGAALERARPDQGRRPLRRHVDARRMRRAGDVDDVEVRAAAAPVRRREGRRALQSPRDVARRARAADPALHLRAAADHRPAGGHAGAGHGHERADDGLDDGHVLDAGGLRRARRS